MLSVCHGCISRDRLLPKREATVGLGGSAKEEATDAASKACAPGFDVAGFLLQGRFFLPSVVAATKTIGLAEATGLMNSGSSSDLASSMRMTAAQ
jgi:hypothetical protein